MAPGSTPAWKRPLYHLYRTEADRASEHDWLCNRSLSEVLRRHEILRTKFPSSPTANRCRWFPILTRLEVEIIDLRHLPETEREPKAYEIAAPKASGRSTLPATGCFESSCSSPGANLHVIIVDDAAHHLRWLVVLSCSAKSALCTTCFAKSRPSPLPELSAQYQDYAAWQRDWVKSERRDATSLLEEPAGRRSRGHELAARSRSACCPQLPRRRVRTEFAADIIASSACCALESGRHCSWACYLPLRAASPVLPSDRRRRRVACCKQRPHGSRRSHRLLFQYPAVPNRPVRRSHVPRIAAEGAGPNDGRPRLSEHSG